MKMTTEEIKEVNNVVKHPEASRTGENRFSLSDCDNMARNLHREKHDVEYSLDHPCFCLSSDSQ